MVPLGECMNIQDSEQQELETMSSPLSFRASSPIISRNVSRQDEDDSPRGSRASSPYIALGGSPHVGSPYLRQTYSPRAQKKRINQQNDGGSSRNPAVAQSSALQFDGHKQYNRDYDDEDEYDHLSANNIVSVGSLPARWNPPSLHTTHTLDRPHETDSRPPGFSSSISTTEQPQYSANNSVSINPDAESSVDEAHDRKVVVPPLLKGYLIGQIANVLKAGIWWVGFSPLILAIFKANGDYVVGYARIAFNLSLLLLSPIAGGVVEKVSIKKLLNLATIGRGLIYGLVLPFGWLLLVSDVIIKHNDTMTTAFTVLFVSLVLCDGVVVAFANIADIDSGGTDLVAVQYGIPVNDNLRNHFNSLHILCFDGSMVVFAPAMAALGVVFATHVDAQGKSSELVDTMAVMGSMMVVFIVASFISLYYYSTALPPKPAPTPISVADHDIGPVVGKCAQICEAIVEGFKMTWQHSRIRYRVLFLALEVALEDAMISIVIAQYAYHITENSTNPTVLKYKSAYGNLWAAGITSVGKIGGVITSILMHKCFHVDPAQPAGSAYRALFYFVALGGVAAMGIPIAFHFLPSGSAMLTQEIIVVVSCFFFFLFSTVGKIGFATLMQSLAAEFGASGRVFGFLAVAVTGTDALILMGLSTLFASYGPEDLGTPLWVCCGLICGHGLIECVFGPCLVLGSDKKDQQKQDLRSKLLA